VQSWPTRKLKVKNIIVIVVVVVVVVKRLYEFVSN